MSFFSNVFDFEKSAMGDRLDLAKKDWWRVPLGIMDQGSTEIFNGLTGKSLEPMVDYFGGTTDQNVANAKAAGINTGPGEGMHNIARLATSLFAGGYGADKLGMLGGGPIDGSMVGSGADATTVPLGSLQQSSSAPWMNWANLATKLPMPSGGSQPQSVDLNPYVQPPAQQEVGVLEQPDARREAYIRALYGRMT